MAEGGSEKEVISLREIMRQQQLEEEVNRTAMNDDHREPTPRRKKKAKHTKKEISQDEYNLVRRTPLEESFNTSQNLQAVRNTISSRQTRLTPRTWTPQMINELAKQVIGNIADNDDYVSLDLVKATMCEEIGIQSLKNMGYRNPDIEIPELKELQRLHSKLDLYARAYVMVHSISTLKEIGQSMARLLEKRDFQELRVGPLVKQPVIYDLFKAPSDGSTIQDITTLQVLKNLNQYLTKEEKWTSKVNLPDFLQYLCDEYECKTPYDLGIRVQSIGLGISVLKRAQRAQSERSKQVEEEITTDLETEFERRCRKIKEDLLGSSHQDERSIIKKLLGTPVIDILQKVFDQCSVVLQNYHRVNKSDYLAVERCLQACVMNKPLRDFFHLALYMGCKDIVKELLQECKEEMAKATIKENQEKEKAVKRPKKDLLVDEVKKWLRSADELTFSTLATIEDRVTNHFQDFPNFVSFGYGTFLEFLNKEAELHKILEERGASLFGVTVSHPKADSLSVLDFVRQCGSQVSEDTIQRALCDYYQVSDITELGFGSFADLKSETERKNPQLSSHVHYESAILCKDDLQVVNPKLYYSADVQVPMRAGLLGMKNPEEALLALRSTPLLVDMIEFTQWTTVFEPCLGHIKQFIENQANYRDESAGSPIEALETSSKALLRIDSKITPSEFKKYVDKEDVIGTSGTLVSIVIGYGGVKGAPLAMLANHMRPTLSKLAIADQMRCPRFVLCCLCRIPQNLCVALANEVFLDPLSSVVGATRYCHLLLSCCTDHRERSCLHHLGLRLGKIELVMDLKVYINPISSHEREEKINWKDLKPVAHVKPVCHVEDVATTIQEEQEEISEGTDLSVGNHVNQVENQDMSTTTEIDEEVAIGPNPCKAVIDSIRSEEFGIGVHLGEKEEKLVQKQREREGRSLHRLSTELYNRDTHFVLELVQNADDNTYTDAKPALMFVVDPKSIEVLNNEVGFSENNIRALCDVGKSTKGPHQYGYIGHKGIGFKSVFRVSDTPEVHSNGYHIRFDAKSGPTGYILPHWLEHDMKQETADQGNCSTEDDNQFDRQWMTRIVLPLKEEFHSDKKTALSARFNDVHPSLLLFLHRLRSIAIVKDNEIERMTRHDLSDDIIQIKHGHGLEDHWLVVKKQLDAQNIREDVEMTELAIAFPMPSDEGAKNPTLTHVALPPQNVFAYLPLRSYGFKFIIQGDFEVPSSRGEVDGDKAWNQWLREEIPKLFIDALKIFKQQPSFPGLSSVVKYFQFVPLEEEILDFFTPVSTGIIKHLQGISCLPVEKPMEGGVRTTDGNGSKMQDYEWMQPCSVVVCNDPKIRGFITPSILRDHLNLNYLAQEVAPAINPALRSKLGIQTLSVKHLIEIGKSVLKCSGPPDVDWVAHWLHCIQRSLDSEHNSSPATLSEIATMDIIPLSDNTFVNVKDRAVFFPLSNEHGTTKAKEKKSKPSYMEELQRDLSVIHFDLLSCLGQVGHSQVQNLLQRLGVKKWSANEVIHNHILPSLKSDSWKNKSPTLIQSYLVYIFDQRLADQSLCSMVDLKECCQVLTNHGLVNPSKTPVHFTPKYGNKLDLRVDLSSISWTLLEDSYLDLSANTSTRREDWEVFFRDLGVTHFLAVERKTVKLTKMNLDDSPWALHYSEWPETSDGVYVVEDCCCTELEEFMNNIKDPKESKVLAEYLDKNWATQYSVYTDCVPVKSTAGLKLQDTMSSFILLLRTKEWLPVVSSRESFRAPKNAFADTPQLRSLLNEHVSYADVKLGEESFMKAIELGFSISEDELLDYLCEWSSKARVQGDQGFATSLDHMRKVYSFLYDKCNKSDTSKHKIASRFQKNPLIFVPKKDPKAAERRAVQGIFYQLKEVCWNDPSEVTTKLLATKKYTPKRQILCQYYKESHDFLRLELNVDPTPHTDEYIEMAAVLVDENPLPTPQVLESILEIVAVLGEKCLKRAPKANPNKLQDAKFGEVMDDDIDASISNYLQTKLHQENIFPCGNRWVALEDKPVVADNKVLKKIFEQEKDVHFLTIEQSGLRKGKSGNQKKKRLLDVFIKACGIPRLSDIVEEELTPNKVEYQCHDVQLYFHKIIPCIQRYLCYKLEERYDELKALSFAQKLSEMTFATVEKLEVVYRLKDHPGVTVVQEKKYGFENVGQALHLYAVRQQTKSMETLNKEISKLFTQNSVDFGNFLSRLTTKLGDGLESFLEEQDIELLPDNEEKWFVPEPEIPSAPEPEPLEDSFQCPPVVRRVTQAENDGVLHCWPPRSSSTGIKPSIRESQQDQPKAPELWPVPDAPSSMGNQSPGYSNLPSHNSIAAEQSRVEKGDVTKVDQIQQHKPLIPKDDNIGSIHLPEPLVQDSGRTDEARVEGAEGVQIRPPIIHPHSTPMASTQGNQLVQLYAPDAASSPANQGNAPGVFSPIIHMNIDEPEEFHSDTDITLPLNVSLNDSSDKHDIGRWGEQYVYEYLRNKIKPDSGDVEVIWINKEFNSTSPYDIEIVQKNNNGEDIVTYVEVKSTSTPDKDYFEISVPELQFSLEKREAFHLYRVFNAGDTNAVRIIRMQNLALYLERKQVKIFIATSQHSHRTQ